jgi:hypothetical protein
VNQLSLVLLLAAHLLSVNLASASPLVALWLDWREGRGDQAAGSVGRQLTWLALGLLCAGTAFGLMVGALLWDEPYREVLRRFDRRITYAVWELLFSLVLLAVAGIWWSLTPDSHPRARALRMLLQIAASSNLLYHFPPLLILVSDVAAGSIEASATVDAAEFRRLMLSDTVLARATHFWLASLAVAGIATMHCAHWSARGGSRVDPRLVTGGARVALLPTILQLPAGVWLITTLPLLAQQQLLGGDLPAAVLLGLSLALTLWLLHLLSAAALGDTTRRTTQWSAAVMVAIVTLMTGVLVRVAA